MHRHLQKLLLVALIASFCGQAQGADWHIAISTALQRTPPTQDYLLRKAIEDGDTARVKSLVDTGADVNATPHERQEPLLCLAGQRGLHHIVQILIDAGADLNAKGTDGTALQGTNHKRIIWTLIAAGADITTQPFPKIHRAAMAAEAYCNHDITFTLIAAGANINTQDGLGQTPLHCLANCGYLGQVKFLVLTAGANKDLQDTTGETAADIALRKSYTAVHAEQRSNYQMIHAFLTDPATVSRMSPEIELCRAISSNNPAILKETIDRLAYPINRPVSEDGNTLLHYAAMRGFIRQALLLLSYGADPRQTNTEGVQAINMGTAKFRRALATGTERSHLALAALERPSSTHTSVLPRAITEQIFAFAGDLNPLPETLIAGISGLEIDKVMALRPGTHIAAVLDAHKRAAAKSERRAQAEERADAADRRQRRRLADGSAEASPRHADGCTGANGCPGCGHE